MAAGIFLDKSIPWGGKMEYAYSMNCSVGKAWDRLHGKVQQPVSCVCPFRADQESGGKIV